MPFIFVNIVNFTDTKVIKKTILSIIERLLNVFMVSNCLNYLLIKLSGFYLALKQ